MNRSTRRVLLVRRLNRVSSLTPTPMGSSITPTAVAAVNPPNNRQQQPPPRLSAATALLHPRRHENCSHGSNSSSSRSFSVARLFCQSPCADTPWTRNHPGHHHHQQSQQLRHLTPKRRPLSFSSSSSPPSPLAPPAATSPFREDASVLQPTANTPAAATSEDSLCAAMQSWEDPTTTTIIVQQQQQQRAPSTDATTTTASTGTNTSSNNDAQLILNEHEKNDWIQQFHSGIQLLQTFLTARDGRNQMAPSSELHPPATVGSRSPTTPATGHREPPGGAELRAALDLYGRILRGTFYAATHVTTTNANCNSNSNSSNNNTNNNNNNFFGTCEWMGEARHLLNPLVYHWHGAWLLSSKRDDNRKSTLLQPLELIQSLYTLSHQIPFFRYDIATIGMIVKVVSRYPPRAPMYRDRSRGGLILSRYWPKQEEQQQMQRQLPQQQYQARQAAMAAQALLEFAADQSQKLDCPRLRPDVVTYSQVIAAWTAAAPFSNIKSITIARDDDEIPRRLQALVKDMYDRFGLVPNPIIYTTLLRFWAERGSVQQVEQLLDDMATHGVEPTLSCLAQALYCYAKASEAFMAEGLLDVMIEQHLALRQPQQSHVEHDNSLPSATDAKASNLKIDRQHVKGSDARSVKLIVAGAIKVMDMYRQNLVKGNKVDSARNDQILSSAEALLQKLVLTELLTPNSHGKYACVCMQDLFCLSKY